MKKSMILFSILFIAVSAPRARAQAALNLDHFKCYVIREAVPPLPEDLAVILEDQFDELFGKRVGGFSSLIQAVLFCNPTQKVTDRGNTLILNRNNHLKMYLLKQALFGRDDGVVVKPIDLRVVVENQFGTTQQLGVRWGSINELLAVPTQKVERNLGPPSGLDHFKCYEAFGDPINKVVILIDQFLGERVTVLSPQSFCNPAAKTVSGVTTPIQNHDAHLTCYGITQLTPQPFQQQQVQTLNQFGTESLVVDGARSLCVPSRKLSVECGLPFLPDCTLPEPTPICFIDESGQLICKTQSG